MRARIAIAATTGPAMTPAFGLCAGTAVGVEVDEDEAELAL